MQGKDEGGQNTHQKGDDIQGKQMKSKDSRVCVRIPDTECLSFSQDSLSYLGEL